MWLYLAALQGSAALATIVNFVSVKYYWMAVKERWHQQPTEPCIYRI